MQGSRRLGEGSGEERGPLASWTASAVQTPGGESVNGVPGESVGLAQVRRCSPIQPTVLPGAQAKQSVWSGWQRPGHSAQIPERPA